jgi:hypothetical protein
LETKIAISFDVEERKLAPSALSIPLDMLDRHNIKATFFILGRLADRNPEVVTEILSRGHELGCHGYVHDPYDLKGIEEVKTDVERGTRAVRKFGDVVGFRAPYFRPHRRLGTILEDFGYRYDSSVASKRFDLFVGRTNNPYTFLAPMKPYHPSTENIFRKGKLEILEIPLPGVILPLLGATMRNTGLKFFTRFTNFVNLFSEFIMFDIHVWEFLEEHDVSIRRQSVFFHRRRKGEETALMFDEFLCYLKQKGTFIQLSGFLNKSKGIT